MGVDNNAILFVGLPYYDVAEKFNLLENGSSLEKPEYHPTNNDDAVVGFMICDSGSYGLKIIENCSDRIIESERKFELMFGLKAKTYLFNHQW